MKSLGPLPLDTLPYFTTIVAGKQQPRRERLENLAAQIEARYNLYAQNTANLAPVPILNFGLQDKEDLIHCYGSPTGALNRLKADIKNHHNNACPDVAAVCQYCGLTCDPSAYDHYLPKETFPEFSVLSINLVPCCGRCNELKGTAWIDANGAREIVSFYYDALPNQQFLSAEVVLNNGARIVPVANFHLSDNPADYGGMRATIQNHFRVLHLLARYRRAASARFSDVKTVFGALVQSKGRDVVAQILLNTAQKLAQSRSPNYWEVALLAGMASNPAYLDSLP